jgi:hypothetical protein
MIVGARDAFRSDTDLGKGIATALGDNVGTRGKDPSMWVRRFLVVLALSCLFLPSQAHAADVAVRPVERSNLTEGEADAIGVMFATAFARDARVTVASPLATKPLDTGDKTPGAISQELGASRYVELRARKVGNMVSLGGALHAQDGAPIWQAETTAWTLESMDAAVTTLSQALAWRRPIRPAPIGASSGIAPPPAYETPSAAEGVADEADDKVSKASNGVKVGLMVPRFSDTTFSPTVMIQFDGRLGPRDYFLEYGAGLFMPSNEHYGDESVDVEAAFIEIGGSYYLWDANVALYVGGGLTPTIWMSKSGYQDHLSATCGAYGQAGITFTRNSRAKLYAEFRLTQLLLPVAVAVGDPYSSSAQSDTFYPTLLSFQGGIGW